jgi:hypothetical protein
MARTKLTARKQVLAPRRRNDVPQSPTMMVIMLATF